MGSQRTGTYSRMNPLLYHLFEADIDQSKFESAVLDSGEYKIGSPLP